MISLKTCFHIKVNLGNYQSAEFGVDDFDGSLSEAKQFVMDYISEYTNVMLDRHALSVLYSKK